MLFVHILPGTVIGDHCSLGQNVVAGPEVKIGNSCKIQNKGVIYKGVELEESLICGRSIVFTNITNPRADINRRSEFSKTRVRKGVRIIRNPSTEIFMKNFKTR